MQLHDQGAADCQAHDFTFPTRTGKPDMNYTLGMVLDCDNLLNDNLS